jgi:DNA-binding transcriptional MerR regulator
MTEALTVTRLARRFRLSRTALLHYDALGLLRPSARSPAGYRLYAPADVDRLAEICRLRRAGLSLAAIARVLDTPQTLASVLRARLDELRGEIEARRGQERFILGLLRTGAAQEALEEVPVMNKARWTALLRAAGFSGDDMRRWHADFERTAPAEHEAFLEFLCIPEDERALIRARARARVPEGARSGADSRPRAAPGAASARRRRS